MNYPKIASKFYGTEWFVRADWHLNAGQILRPYLTGEAVVPMTGSPSFARPRPADDGNIAGVQLSEGFAMIRVDGTIGRHLDFFESCSGGYDLARLESQILQLEERSEIHSVIFSFNTPGGVAAGVPEAAELIRNLGESKRTVAWIDNEACSAGYFMAAACGEVYGQPSAIVGCISTIMALLDSSRAMEMQGFALEIFTDGELKGIGRPGASLTDNQRKFLEERRDEIGQGFKSFVSEQRPGIPPEAMEGGWYSGQSALDFDLVDGFFGNLSELMAALIDRAA